MKENHVFINGKYFLKNEATVSVFDHGLLYGDGIFEGMRSYNGLVFRMEEHLDRLWESAKSIMLSIPYTKKQMNDLVIQTLQKNKLKDAYIRLVITRGTGDLGLDPRKCKVPTVFIISDKIVLYDGEIYAKGVEVVTVPTVRNFTEAVNPAIKSLNYLNNILAKIEATNAGFCDAVMLNHQGYVTECSGANIFIVKDGALFTPPTYVGALKGITRCAILDTARKLRVPFQERILTRHDLFNADECFLTGTAAEIVPVVKVDGRVIGNGKPGETTHSLTLGFRDLTKVDGVRYKI
ncbi:MAG: branched-chain-amino-acid transaminase [Candidatus Omnitrophica bacterium]|nr:branched-chain-amino-acid transaminase [Candidatus Omnitrophota bacterium]